jgi:hypothetical protein
MKTFNWLLLVVLLISLAACTSTTAAPSNLPPTLSIVEPTRTEATLEELPTVEISSSNNPVETETVTAPTAEPIVVPINPTIEPGTYPATPETVVYAFLGAYQEDPTSMSVYLSQNLLGQLPDGNIYGLLGFDTSLEGFVFEAGTGDSQTASVDVSLQTGSVALQRIFHLIQQSGLWVIDQIEIPQ